MLIYVDIIYIYLYIYIYIIIDECCWGEHCEQFREVSFVDPSVCDASNCCSGFVQQALYILFEFLFWMLFCYLIFVPSSFVD